MEQVLSLRLDRVKDKTQLVDVQVLRILVTSAMKIEDTDSQKLIPKLNALLDSIHAKMASPGVFLESARFYEFQGFLRKAIEFRLKAYRLLLHAPQLLNEPQLFEYLGSTTLEVVDSYVDLGSQMEKDRMGDDDTQLSIVCKDWQYQARTCLKTVVGRTRSTYEGTEMHEKLQKRLEEVVQMGIDHSR